MTLTQADFSDRETLMRTNSALIEQLQTRLRAKRYRPQEGDTSKLGYINALIQAVQVQNSILESTELEEIKEEIEKIKEQRHV